MLDHKSKMRNAIFLMVVLIAATVYYFFFSQNVVTFHLSKEQNQITIQAGKDQAFTAPFSEIDEILLIDDFEKGTAVDGKNSWNGVYYGNWNNAVIGDYEAFLTSRVKSTIVIKTADKTVAFSLENNETMQSLFVQLKEYWQTHR